MRVDVAVQNSVSFECGSSRIVITEISLNPLLNLLACSPWGLIFSSMTNWREGECSFAMISAAERKSWMYGFARRNSTWRTWRSSRRMFLSWPEVFGGRLMLWNLVSASLSTSSGSKTYSWEYTGGDLSSGCKGPNPITTLAWSQEQQVFLFSWGHAYF